MINRGCSSPAGGGTMDIIEYRAKDVFRRYGIPVPKGVHVSAPGDLEGLDRISSKVALKSQVPIGGRGKAGGIKFASSLEEARSKVSELLEMDIRGFRVRSVLVEEMLDIERELYLGITLDRSTRKHLIMGAAEGGVDIESLPDEDIIRVHVNPLVGLRDYQVREVVSGYPLDREQRRLLASIVRRAYDLYQAEDATLVEINPLVLTKEGRLIAADAKLTIDDDALFRHRGYERVESALTPLEMKAREKGIAFIQLDGNIGVIANGAGLTMATLDSLMLHGGKGGVFLDLGGTDDPKKVTEAFRLMHEAEPPVILLNIFGGITKCDTVAEGIRDALDSVEKRVPTVVRIRGLHEERARQILRDAGFVPCGTLSDAARTAVSLESGG